MKANNLIIAMSRRVQVRRFYFHWCLVLCCLQLSLTQTSWTEWSDCSVSCDQGVKFRVRQCQKTDIKCYERERQLKVCKKTACEGKTLDYRSKECRKYNSKKFRGRYYQWDKHINANHRCTLTCRAIYYGFYAILKDQVKDGIPCDDKSEDVCMEGECVKVGCDGVVGSGAERDRCGVCNGNNKSCQLISGIFTRSFLPYGYNLITRIPKGACNVNITEMGTSRNYLALRLKDGTYIINGNRGLSRQGTYQAAGTSFTYGKREGLGCPGECIKSKGPVNQTIDVQLLYYRRSPGIVYQFTVPKHMTKDIMQRIIPRLKVEHLATRQKQLLSSSNMADSRQVVQTGYENIPTGSGGYPIPSGTRPHIIPNRRAYVQSPPSYIPLPNNRYQHVQSLTIDSRRQGKLSNNTNVRLHTSYYNQANRDNQAVSGDYGRRYSPKVQESHNAIDGSYSARYSNRNDNRIPVLSAQNIPDGENYDWRIVGFTDCSTTCGRGIQQTKVVCMKKGVNLIVTDDNCIPDARPAVQTVTCNTQICPPGWDVGEWSDCSASCDQGMQTRPVVCKQRVSAISKMTVPASRCGQQVRPESARSCSKRPCAEWKIGEWKKCSSICGKGEKSRMVVCHSADGRNVTDNQCKGHKPISSKICDMGSCAQGWFHSRWTEHCHPGCGKGHLSRKVYCSAPDGTKLPETKCPKRKPKEKRSCRSKTACGGDWFEGPWSECSTTCGNGVHERSVICVKKLGKKLYTVVSKENCAGKNKPETEKPCDSLPSCDPEWFMTKWSSCSKSCGTGIKTREVKCLDDALKLTSDCPASMKPSRRNACNTQSCEQPQLDEDPSCKDKYKDCRLVVQARLCMYGFYRNKCCHSCRSHDHRKTKEKS